MKGKIVLIIIAAIALVIIAAASFHSVEEIHWLKQSFPAEFTVAEAKDAAIIELIKIFFISFPLLIVIALCVIIILRRYKP